LNQKPKRQSTEEAITELLRASPRFDEAPEVFKKGTAAQLAQMPAQVALEQTYGVGRRNRARRDSLAARMKGLARRIRHDPEASNLTILELAFDAGPYRVKWLRGRVKNRPTLARVLIEAAEQLESAIDQPDVKLPRDIILGVATILDQREAIIASALEGAVRRSRPIQLIADISSLLLAQPISVDAVRKIVARRVEERKQSENKKSPGLS
jgi:hypothetical protein